MPSKRRQFNVRPDEATWAVIDRLKPVVEARLGITLSYTDLLKLAMDALEAKCADDKPKSKPKGGAS